MEVTPEIQAAIDAAVDQATAGLKAKNNELILKNKQLAKGQEIDPKTVDDLESKIDDLNNRLSEQTKLNKELAKSNETLKASFEKEANFSTSMLRDNALNSELSKLGIVDPDYLAAARAMFASNVKIDMDGDNRIVKIGDKPLSEHFKEWGASDTAKKFISPAINTGGGSTGSKGGSDNTKTMPRSAFDQASPATKLDFAKQGGRVVND